MNSLLNKLFGLRTDDGSLGFGSPDARIGFVHPLEPWLIFLIVCVLFFGVWWAYRGVPGRLFARVMMGCARLMALLILFVLALGPMIEQTTIHTEQDWAIVLLDRSQSMSTRDALALGPESKLITRNERLLAMLGDAGSDSDSDIGSPWNELALHKRVVWMDVSEQASEINIGSVPTVDAIAPLNGQSTRLGRGIQAALDRAATRPISSIVLVSDGRSFDAISPELINSLKAAHIPIFSVPMGNDESFKDIGIARIEYPGSVFADDIMPMRVLISSSGITEQDLIARRYRVELRDHATKSILSTTPIREEHLDLDEHALRTWVTLRHTPDKIGEHEYDIVITESTPARGLDLNPSNDQSIAKVQVVDRPMRVLYIDGYPRWEHRYLKNLLLRERSIQSSSMLFATSRRFIQEGDELIVAVPSTLEEWEPFDVIILGDVRSQLFTDAQLESLLEHVTTHGAGVLWIAGSGATPDSWINSPIASLLPIRKDASGSQSGYPTWDTPVVLRSSPEADRLGLLGLNNERTGWLDRLSDPSTGWSQLHWAQILDPAGLKPGVTVLAYAQSIDAPIDTPSMKSPGLPIITSLRSGSGRSIYIGTDEIWRWRYGRGEDLPERFWLPIIRSLGRGTIARRTAPASLSISPATPLPNKPAQITLRLFDQSLIETTGEQVRIRLSGVSPSNNPIEITLRGTGDTRVGTWIPDSPGSYAVEPIGANQALNAIQSHVRVLDLSDEQRLLDTDHALLTSLSEQTGGQIIGPEDFSTIPSLMPNRARTLASPRVQASLWDRPAVLLVLVLLLAGEWIGRRILRLA